MLEKADLLRIVAAEVDHVKAQKKAQKKQEKAPEDTTWKKVIKTFNDASIKKYRVALATGDAFKLKASANKILKTFGGDLDLVNKVIAYYIEFYEELPFVNIQKFSRPFLASVSVFAPKILEYMERRGDYVAKAEVDQSNSVSGVFTIPGLEDAF